MVKPKIGDRIEFRLEECEGCGAEAFNGIAIIEFGSEKDELWVAKIEGTKYRVIVHIDENAQAICQPAGTAKDIQHWIDESAINDHLPDDEDDEDDLGFGKP